MKSLTQHISEKLVINKNSSHIKYYPKTKAELQKIIKQLVAERGNKANLNDIDVSEITDMSKLFCGDFYGCGLYTFNGDISEWDVSKVENMHRMFAYSCFNGDISNWDISNVKDMSVMFTFSKFNGNISKWNVSNVINMQEMFKESKFNGDISEWNVSNVINMSNMFNESDFNGDISEWNISNVETMWNMFRKAKFNKDISNWKIDEKCDTGFMFEDCQIKEEYKPKLK